MRMRELENKENGIINGRTEFFVYRGLPLLAVDFSFDSHHLSRALFPA